MANSASTQTRSSFALPLLPAVAIGTVATGLFYSLLHFGVLDQPVLKRYCTSHLAAIVSVWLGLMAIIGLAFKLQNTFAQWRILRTIDRMLNKIIAEGEDVDESQRALWLEARWLAVSSWQQTSWTGRRIAEIIERQIRRSGPAMLETDLRDLATDAERQQRDSLAVIRTITLAIPMLGLIGSLMCLSNVLVQSEALTQSGIALGVGLGSAVAPLVVALSVTIPIMFAQQVAGRIDVGLLAATDELLRDSLIEFLSYEAAPTAMVAREPRPTTVEATAPSQQLADDLLAAVHQLVEMQANIWSRSISEAQKQWMSWSGSSGEQLRDTLCQALDKSLTEHALQIERIQQEAGRQVDARWQQWQITLSDQARVMHAQQKELVRQTEAIDQLVTSTCELKKTDEAIHQTFANFELLDQLRQTTLGVGEAVAVLATSLERAGIIRGLPVKPRSARRADDDQFDEQRKVA